MTGGMKYPSVKCSACVLSLTGSLRISEAMRPDALLSSHTTSRWYSGSSFIYGVLLRSIVYSVETVSQILLFHLPYS